MELYPRKGIVVPFNLSECGSRCYKIAAGTMGHPAVLSTLRAPGMKRSADVLIMIIKF